MFKTIRFYFDETGNFQEPPLILQAKDCNANYFSICDTRMRGYFGEVPAVQIRRSLGPLDEDPYDDNGRPPTVLFSILMPHIQHLDDMVHIEGLEDPNLCWAGLLMPPYTNNYKPLNGVNYMNPEMKTPNYVQLKRQRIILT